MPPAKASTKARTLTCPACGTVGSFGPRSRLQCKVCGTAIPDRGVEAPAVEAPLAAPPAPTPVAVLVPPREPPTALAIVALVAGILALVTLWVLPVCILFGLAAIVCGIIALSQEGGDGGARAMAGVGLALGVLALLLMWWAFAVFADDSGSSVYIDNGGGSSGSVEDNDSGGSGGGGSSGGGGGGSGDSGGGDSGDSGGSSGGGGGDSGGSGGGGGVDVETGVDSDTNSSPAPVALLVGLGLLGAAAWRRRA